MHMHVYMYNVCVYHEHYNIKVVISQTLSSAGGLATRVRLSRPEYLVPWPGRDSAASAVWLRPLAVSDGSGHPSCCHSLCLTLCVCVCTYILYMYIYYVAMVTTSLTPLYIHLSKIQHSINHGQLVYMSAIHLLMFGSLFVIYPSSLRLSGNITNKLLTSRCISAHTCTCIHLLAMVYILHIHCTRTCTWACDLSLSHTFIRLEVLEVPYEFSHQKCFLVFVKHRPCVCQHFRLHTDRHGL